MPDSCPEPSCPGVTEFTFLPRRGVPRTFFVSLAAAGTGNQCTRSWCRCAPCWGGGWLRPPATFVPVSSVLGRPHPLGRPLYPLPGVWFNSGLASARDLDVVVVEGMDGWPESARCCGCPRCPRGVPTRQPRCGRAPSLPRCGAVQVLCPASSRSSATFPPVCERRVPSGRDDAVNCGAAGADLAARPHPGAAQSPACTSPASAGLSGAMLAPFLSPTTPPQPFAARIQELGAGREPLCAQGQGDVRVPGGRGGSEWQSQPLALAERFPKHPSVVEVPVFVQVPAVSCCGAGCSVPVAAMPRCWQWLSVLLSSKSSPGRAPLELGLGQSRWKARFHCRGGFLAPASPSSLCSSPGRCRQQRILELEPFHM